MDDTVAMDMILDDDERVGNGMTKSTSVEGVRQIPNADGVPDVTVRAVCESQMQRDDAVATVGCRDGCSCVQGVVDGQAMPFVGQVGATNRIVEVFVSFRVDPNVNERIVSAIVTEYGNQIFHQGVARERVWRHDRVGGVVVANGPRTAEGDTVNVER